MMAKFWLVAVRREQRAQAGEVVARNKPNADKFGKRLLYLNRKHTGQTHKVGEETRAVFLQQFTQQCCARGQLFRAYICFTAAQRLPQIKIGSLHKI
jgi:hypothetical protein